MNMWKSLLLALGLLIIGCAGSPAWVSIQEVPDSANITVVTHPKKIETLDFVDGFTTEFHYTVPSYGEEHAVAYTVYDMGYTDVVVYYEAGISLGYYYPVRITICR